MSGFSSNNREIPFFSVPDRNRIENYVPFRNASRYLKAKSSRFRDTHELLALPGYSRKKQEVGLISRRSARKSKATSLPAQLPESLRRQD